jgi:hypothetical protein
MGVREKNTYNLQRHITGLWSGRLLHTAGHPGRSLATQVHLDECVDGGDGPLNAGSGAVGVYCEMQKVKAERAPPAAPRYVECCDEDVVTRGSSGPSLCDRTG